MLLHTLGLTTGAGSLFEFIFGQGHNFHLSVGYILIVTLFTVLTGVSIIYGTFGKQSTDTAVRSPFAYALFGVTMGEMYSLITIANAYAPWVQTAIELIIFPLMIGYVIAIIQWWGGNDI